MRRQRTIARDAAVSGIGLFGSGDVTLTFLPAPENHGIAFERVDLADSIRIPALIDHVAPRLTHLKTFFVPNEPVNIDVFERHVVHKLYALHYHSRHPKEYYVVRRNQYVSWVVFL